MVKKFGNAAHKAKVILSVFKEGEKLNGKEIVRRIKRQGYNVNPAHINMFIYYNMLHKHLQKEEINGVNHYFVI
jgi:RNA-splicing ligase RtcB